MANFGNMMKQAEALQRNMQKAQEEIAQLEVTGESGAGMVKVTMTGKHEVKRVQIEPAVIGENARRSGGSGDQRCRSACRERVAAADVFADVGVAVAPWHEVAVLRFR